VELVSMRLAFSSQWLNGSIEVTHEHISNVRIQTRRSTRAATLTRLSS
jgi:hypothetical protein